VTVTKLVSLGPQVEGVRVLRLQDAENKNAFTEPLIHELSHALDELSHDSDTRVCVFAGTPEIFCSGAAESMLVELAKGSMAASDIVLPKLVLDLPMPTIAAMRGHAVGGGLSLGLCCDMVVMSRESRYGCSFMNMGFTPGMASTRLVQLAFGDYIANEMLFGGEMKKGKSLEGRGNINAVVGQDEVEPLAMRMARRIADKPRFALETLKRYLSLPRRKLFEETRTIETLMHQLTFARPETRARIAQEYAPQTEDR
jgi:polyketide biosynthesis enoyl-CoA hydratase PksI